MVDMVLGVRGMNELMGAMRRRSGRACRNFGVIMPTRRPFVLWRNNNNNNNERLCWLEDRKKLCPVFRDPGRKKDFCC